MSASRLFATREHWRSTFQLFISARCTDARSKVAIWCLAQDDHVIVIVQIRIQNFIHRVCDERFHRTMAEASKLVQCSFPHPYQIRSRWCIRMAPSHKCNQHHHRRHHLNMSINRQPRRQLIRWNRANSMIRNMSVTLKMMATSPLMIPRFHSPIIRPIVTTSRHQFRQQEHRRQRRRHHRKTNLTTTVWRGAAAIWHHRFAWKATKNWQGNWTTWLMTFWTWAMEVTVPASANERVRIPSNAPTAH